MQVLRDSETQLMAEKAAMQTELEKKGKDADDAKSLRAECEKLREQVLEL